MWKKGCAFEGKKKLGGGEMHRGRKEVSESKNALGRKNRLQTRFEGIHPSNGKLKYNPMNSVKRKEGAEFAESDPSRVWKNRAGTLDCRLRRTAGSRKKEWETLAQGESKRYDFKGGRGGVSLVS